MSQSPPTDESLMCRYRDGDVASFDRLYQRHRGPLYRHLLRQCGNRGTADELFQDVWLGVIDARERYQPQARFTTWLYRIAHNRLVDHYRRRPSAGELSLDDEGDGGDESPAVLAVMDGAADPALRIEWRQSLGRLADGIDALPPVQREAFLLRQEAGLELDAIAEVTGVGIETARSRLRYAMDRLRQWVGLPRSAPAACDGAQPAGRIAQ